MTHVVTEACIRCKYTDCVEVCPVDAFREGRNMLVIDPDECIDCRLCIPEYPVDAIYAGEEVPIAQQAFFGINAELAKRWPIVMRSKAALPDAEEWAGIPDKIDKLDPHGANDES